MTQNEQQPWLTPQESVEVMELLTEVSDTLVNTARFAALRKTLREDLERKARECTEFVRRKNNLVVDESVMLAAIDLAERLNVTLAQVVTEALEHYISQINKRKSG